MKHAKVLQIVCTLILAAAAIVLVGTRMIGTDLPDFVIRICGVSAIAALPVFSYTTVKRIKNKIDE